MSKIAGELNAEMMKKVIHDRRAKLFAEIVSKTGSKQSVIDRAMQEIESLREQVEKLTKERLLGAERIDMDYLHKQLFDALESMDKMHKMMMAKVNHRASFYDAECLDAMNNAPILAAQAMAAYRQAFPPVVPNAELNGARSASD